MELLKELVADIPDAKVLEVRTCVRWTAVVTETGCGLASTLQNRGHCGMPERRVRDCGNLTHKTARELAQYLLADHLLEASIGMAAVNAQIRVDEDLVVRGDIADLLADKLSGKKLAVIGHFPLVEKLKPMAAKVWVIEQNPSAEDLDVEEGKKVIPESDVVVITGTALINRTLLPILDLCRKNAYKALLGPSVPLSPVLFRYGIDLLSGSRVVDAGKVLAYISQGACFQQIQGVEKISLARP